MIEVFIRNKDAKDNNVVVIKNNFINDSRIQSISENIDFTLKSLEQYEIAMLKQEREKVIANLEEWVEKNKNDYCEDFGNGILQIDYEDLRQKLNEMKGD